MYSMADLHGVKNRRLDCTTPMTAITCQSVFAFLLEWLISEQSTTIWTHSVRKLRVSHKNATIFAETHFNSSIRKVCLKWQIRIRLLKMRTKLNWFQGVRFPVAKQTVVSVVESSTVYLSYEKKSFFDALAYKLSINSHYKLISSMNAYKAVKWDHNYKECLRVETKTCIHRFGKSIMQIAWDAEWQ